MNTFSRRHADGGFRNWSNQPARSARFTTQVSPTIGIRLARLLRAPVFVFGKLVVILGVVAVIVSGALGVILALADDPPPTQGDWLAAGGIGVGGIVAIVIGRASVRDRRRLVLFLRKFGYSEATTATTYAAERAMGRRWRLVTLDDDSATAPIGVSPGLRRRSNVFGLLGVFLIVGSIGFVTYWVATGGPDRKFDSLSNGLIEQFEEENPDPSFGESMGNAIFAPLLAAFALAVLIIVGVIALVTLWTACIDLWITRIAVRRAERSKSWRMETDGVVEPIADAIGRRAGKVHAPRMFVVRAADRVWQRAVRALANHADAVIIDISHPTENLLWEIRELHQRHDVNWVFVCAAGAPVVTPSTADGRMKTLLSLIGDEQVIVYAPGQPQDRRFARSLRNQLDRSVHGPR